MWNLAPVPAPTTLAGCGAPVLNEVFSVTSPQVQSTSASAAEPSRIKIVATIGPASEGRIDELLQAGVSVARVNFSHGTPDEHRRRVDLLRRAARRAGRPLGILADLPGPKLRLARFAGGAREMSRGEIVRIRQADGIAGPGEVFFNFGGFLEAVAPGDRMVLADGQCVLVVEELEGDSVRARVRTAGVLGDGKGVHLPDSALQYELPTSRDREWIRLAVELEVDMLGISFVGRASEVREIRSLAGDLWMVAKIERKQALDHLAEILDAVDGVMVARGDLGVELDLERLPLVQKELLLAAARRGRFTITATEMLESMVHSSRPTRAEVADVANAVLDGTDALMLSAETAVGRYPVEAVQTMARVAQVIETSPQYAALPEVGFLRAEPDSANAVAKAAVEAAEALGISKVVCFTESGRTARLLSRYRPRAEVIALSPSSRTVNRMTALAHVRPLLFEQHASIEQMILEASDMLLERGLGRRDEPIVFVAGVPPGVARSTNVLKVHHLGEVLRLH